MKRLGDWIQTYTGRQFWPLDPRPEDVCIEDIAHALSLQCRFTGHTKYFYSVAQHSAYVAHAVGFTDLRHALAALLHDAAEAYLTDIPRPLKRLTEFGAYRNAEADMMMCIARRFGLEPVLFDRNEIKTADIRMLATEQRDLMSDPPAPWSLGVDPYTWRIQPQACGEAEQTFLQMFNDLEGAIRWAH